MVCLLSEKESIEEETYMFKVSFIRSVILISIYFISLNAYELPEIKLHKDKRPEIVLFSAKSILVEDKLSYIIEWKTINATDVMITYIGKIDLSGTITITEEEYKRGAITLTASSRTSSFSDSKTINKFVKKDAQAPIIIREEREPATQHYYNSRPYRRVAPRGYRRRY